MPTKTVKTVQCHNSLRKLKYTISRSFKCLFIPKCDYGFY